jgi:benzoyl-CoA oxygenase B subunit
MPSTAGASCWPRVRRIRQVNFGTHKGEKAWQEVPGEYRAMLRRLIVGARAILSPPASSSSATSARRRLLYDMRNLFQVNVEEGRHLWAMVYLLQKYFGKDGREEAEGLLQRRSGDADKPRMLGAFNEATPDWLSFFMFTFFTDRDGKMQLESLAQSGFDPLSRTCRFMLTEEAHHMFVGETGVGRAIEATCAAMKAAGIEDPYDINAVRKLGVIDLPTMQKKANLHFSLSLDLFGSEVSPTPANYYNRAQGPLPGDAHRRRPPADQRRLSRQKICERPDQTDRRAGADRHQHAPARRLRGRLRQGRGALEQGDREGRRQFQAEVAARRLPPPHRRVPERQGVSRRQGAERR